jgi:hypothetical protein
MLPAEYYLPTEGRTPANSATVRTVYIIGPDKKVRLTMTYPMSVGRNFAEILRALDAVQATDGVPLATPANWVPGQDVIVALAAEQRPGPRALWRTGHQAAVSAVREGDCIPIGSACGLIGTKDTDCRRFSPM